MTIVFSGNTDFKKNNFFVEKGEGDLDMFVVTGKNVNNNIELMLLKANVKAQLIPQQENPDCARGGYCGCSYLY